MGVILRPNQEQRERSLDRMLRHAQAMEGKNDILRTWEQHGIEVCRKEHDYLLGLRVRIRKTRTLLSHMRP